MSRPFHGIPKAGESLGDRDRLSRPTCGDFESVDMIAQRRVVVAHTGEDISVRGLSSPWNKFHGRDLQRDSSGRRGRCWENRFFVAFARQNERS